MILISRNGSSTIFTRFSPIRPKPAQSYASFTDARRLDGVRIGVLREYMRRSLLTMADDDSNGGVHGVVFRGRRYDTGDRLDYIKANVQLAAEREDLGPGLREWLKEFVGTFDE